MSDTFLRDTSIAVGATFGLTCLIRLCCVRMRRYRSQQQQQQTPITPSPFPEVLQQTNNPPPSYPIQVIPQYPIPSAPPSTPQYIVYPGVQYPPYPINQMQQQPPQMYPIQPLAQPYPYRM